MSIFFYRFPCRYSCPNSRRFLTGSDESFPSGHHLRELRWQVALSAESRKKKIKRMSNLKPTCASSGQRTGQRKLAHAGLDFLSKALLSRTRFAPPLYTEFEEYYLERGLHFEAYHVAHSTAERGTTSRSDCAALFLFCCSVSGGGGDGQAQEGR